TKTAITGIPVMVFNPLSWVRDDITQISLNFDAGIPSNLAVYDVATNKKVASSVVSKDSGAKKATISFAAKNLPSMGYKMFDVRTEDGTVTNNLSVQPDTFTMENDSLKVTIDASTGNISQIYNKKDNNREVFAHGYEGNELQILKDTGGSDYPAWNVLKDEMNASPVAVLNTKPDSIEIVQNTPEKKVVRVSRTWSKSTFAQDITLCADSDRVDVKMNVNWNEDNRMLKIAFPFAANSDKATYEIAYGSVERPTTRDNSIDAAKFEVSGHKWADITDTSKDFGTSILNDSKYGWDALKISDNGNSATRLRLTALRSPIGASVRNPNSWAPPAYNIDKTEHNFTYSIYPHAGTWQDANSVHKGDELNYKAEAVQVDQHESRGLGTSESFTSSSADNVIISALKTPQDDPNSKTKMIMRVYEADGKDNTSTTITLPSNIKSAKEVNMLEYDDESLNKKITIDGNKLTFNMNKYEITTIAIELDPYENGDADVTLKDAQTDLFNYYNIDAVSSNEKKDDGNYDGNGDTIPAELWPDTVTFQGVNFNLGPAKDGYRNMVQANGQKIDLPQGNYKYVYILGAGAGNGDKNGTFTVNQSDNTTVSRNLEFAGWNTNLSGWDRFSNMNIYPNVKDQVGHFFTHFHNGSTDRMTVDNYLFVYTIPVDPEKGLDSIQLPKASGMKIAAISVADSDYLRTTNVSTGTDEETLPAITGVSADMVTGGAALGDQAKVTWDLANGISAYKIYRGTTEDFTLANATFAGSVGGTQNSYVDTLPYQGEFVYKVIGVDVSSNKTKLSEASNIVNGGLNNAFQTVPKSSITAPGGFNNEEPYKACDGNPATKWCYRNDALYLQVDLGEDNDWNISKLTLVNAGDAEQAKYITRDFRIESSNDGTHWTTIADRTNNTENKVDIVLDAPITARYFKLTPYYAAQSSGDWNCARIYEFQAWGTSSRTLTPSAQNLAISAVADKTDSPQVTFTGSYEYVNSSMTGTEGSTKLQWYESSDGTTFSLIQGATQKTLTMDASDAFAMKAIKFEVTPVDKYDTAGDPVEKILILNDPTKDIFEGKSTVASHQFKDAESGSMLTDGNLVTKWCADGVYPNNPRYAIIDTQGTYDFSKIVMWHATAPIEQKIPGANSADSDPKFNTRDYKIYVSTDKKSWKEITSVTGNSSSITTDTYKDGTAVGRYIKLEVAKGVDFGTDGNTPADGNSCVRINEVLGYGKLLKFAESTQADDISNVTPQNVSIVNTVNHTLPVAGDTLKVKFDVDAKYLDLARFRWQVSDTKTGPFTAIADSYADTYTISSKYVGKWVRASIRIDQGTTVSSDPIQISKNTDGSWSISFAPFDPKVVTATVDKATAPKGEKVTVTATPLGTNKKVAVTVTDAENNNVPVTAGGANTYTFVMPDNAVKIIVLVSGNGSDTSHHPSNDSTPNVPSSNSTMTTSTNEKGGIVATITTKLDAAPVVTGNHAEVSVTVPADVTSVIASATTEKPVEVKISSPTSEILNQLKNGITVKTVDLTIKVPAAVVNNINANVKVSINVDPSILAAAKDAQKDIAFTVTNSDTGKEIYSWMFSGAGLRNSVTSIVNLNLVLNVALVKNDAIASSVVANNTLGKKTSGIVLKFNHSGLLPGTAKVKVYVGDQEGCTPNSKVFLYYLNSTAKALEQMPQSEYTVDSNGYVTVTISHCSDYVLLPKAATNPYPVKSDTSFPVGVKNGKTYTFAMTVSGKVAPSFAVGNGRVFTSTVKQLGNKYYFTVKAVGAVGTMTAVYSTLPGQKPVVLCYIAVGK
ncbi:MAG: Alpha-mannosidase, partial [Caproiciproducens sp.]|nr:Alpha-mannosidase [Caproiciproducens sp.]